VAGQEAPRVQNGPSPDEPPGVNLRIAYLAWRGLNHEDAWVLSSSAAVRLRTTQRRVQILAIRAIELPPRILVRPRQQVHRGQLLLRRRVAPALLAPAVEQLARLDDLDDIVALEPELADRAPCNGTVVKVEFWDLLTSKNIPTSWHVPDELG